MRRPPLSAASTFVALSVSALCVWSFVEGSYYGQQAVSVLSVVCCAIAATNVFRLGRNASFSLGFAVAWLLFVQAWIVVDSDHFRVLERVDLQRIWFQKEQEQAYFSWLANRARIAEELLRLAFASAAGALTARMARRLKCVACPAPAAKEGGT